MLMSASYMPLMMWTYPRVLTHDSGLDAEWAMLLLIIASFVMAILHGLVNQRFPTLNGIDMLKVVFGRWCGTAIGCGFFVVYVSYASAAAAMLVDVLQGTFFPNTPRIVMVAILLLMAAYGSFTGVESVARAASLLVPITSFLTLVVFALALQETRTCMLPRGLVHPLAILHGAYHGMPLYVGFNVFLMLSPMYKRTSRRDDLLIPVCSVLVNNLILGFGFISCVCAFGREGLERITYPVLYLFRLVRLNSFVIERVGMYFVISATIYVALFLACQIWALSAVCDRLIQSRKIRERGYAYPIAILAIIISLWFAHAEDIFHYTQEWLAPLSWVLLILDPLIKVILARFAKRRWTRARA